MGKGGTHERPWIYIGPKLFLPQASQWKILKALHDSLHIGRAAMTTMVNKLFVGKGLETTIKNICHAYSLCAYNNPWKKFISSPTVRTYSEKRRYPGEERQICFAKMPPCRGYKYLLVLIDAFTGWTGAFQTGMEKATEVGKALLKETIP